jgi:hypothetical protein
MAIQNAYAQTQQDNKSVSMIQEWIDPKENVKIQFRYSPAKPMLYTLTDLKLSIQDLNTGNNLNDLFANIAILKGDRIFFKFNNITLENGDLLLKVQFVEDGNYQLISQIRSKENIFNYIGLFQYPRSTPTLRQFQLLFYGSIGASHRISSYFWHSRSRHILNISI